MLQVNIGDFEKAMRSDKFRHFLASRWHIKMRDSLGGSPQWASGPVGQSWPRFTKKRGKQKFVQKKPSAYWNLPESHYFFACSKNVVVYPPQGAILNCVLLVLGIHSSTKHGKRVEQTPGLRARSGPKLTFLKQRDSNVGYYPPKTSRKKKTWANHDLYTSYDYCPWLLYRRNLLKKSVPGTFQMNVRSCHDVVTM